MAGYIRSKVKAPKSMLLAEIGKEYKLFVSDEVNALQTMLLVRIIVFFLLQNFLLVKEALEYFEVFMAKK